MEISVDTKEFLTLIERLKKKGPKVNTKRFLNAKVDLFYLAGMAIFRVESVELAIPATGYWGAVVSFPFPVLLSYLTSKPAGEKFQIQFLDSKVILGSFKITASCKAI